MREQARRQGGAFRDREYFGEIDLGHGSRCGRAYPSESPSSCVVKELDDHDARPSDNPEGDRDVTVRASHGRKTYEDKELRTRA